MTLDPPTGLVAELLDAGSTPQLQVSFTPSPDAEGHWLDLGDEFDDVWVDPDDCSEGECQLLLDRLSTAGAASEVSVTASAGDGRSVSPPSDPVALPTWPELPAPVEPDESEPVTLVIARGGGDQPLTLSTEGVAVADAEQRVTDLYLDPDVAGVEVESTAMPLQTDEDTEDRPDLGIHEGTATWQEGALDFPRLPAEPRGRGVTIAVIDGGIWADHPAFDGAEIETVNMVDSGADIVASDHGTAVASLIAGQPGSRVPGIASGSTVIGYDVQAGGDAGGEALAAAVLAAVDDGADVINISMAIGCNRVWPLPTHLGCPPDVLGAAVQHAEEQGVVVVAGAGNNGSGDGCTAWHGHGPDADQWPAKFSTVLAVGGHTRGGDVWRCSPDTNYIDVLAPASSLRAALGPDNPHGDYGTVSGTSFASPLVAGLAAILLAEQPDLTPAEVRAMLRRATTEEGRIVPGMLMAEIGVIPPGSVVVDPTTHQQAVPYTLELQFRPGHPVQVAARAIEDSWMVPDLPVRGEIVGLGPAVWGPITHDTVVHITVVGTFFVDDEGALAGYGVMEGLGDENNYSYSAFRGEWAGDVGHILRCPDVGVPRPYVAFNWVVPASVGGHMISEEYHAEVDLSLSLGLGATPDQPGELPPLNILHDNLDECGGTLAAAAARDDYARGSGLVWSQLCLDQEPGECTSTVGRARNDLSVLTEELYEAIIESVGTLEFSARLGTDGLGSAEAEGAGWDDSMYAILSIGA